MQLLLKQPAVTPEVSRWVHRENDVIDVSIC